MSYTPADYLFCYAVYLKNDTKLVLYYLNSETDFVVEEHELSERLDVGFIKNEDGNIYYRYPNGEYATGVTNIEGEEYYFAADGCMKIGYRKIGNKRYYLMILKDYKTSMLSQDVNIIRIVSIFK